MNNKVAFFIALIICNIINFNILSQPSFDNKSTHESNLKNLPELKNELQKILEDKSDAEMRLKKFEEDFGLCGYVTNEIKLLYAPSKACSEVINSIFAPLEAVRLIAAYLMFPVTIPIFAAGGAMQWYEDKEENEARLKLYKKNIQDCDAKAKATEEMINFFENSIKK